MTELYFTEALRAAMDNAMELIDPIMHGNARRIFNLSEKKKILEKVKWE